MMYSWEGNRGPGEVQEFFLGGGESATVRVRSTVRGRERNLFVRGWEGGEGHMIVKSCKP